ncbi:hypothetical protein E2562_009605 [Oryza meyeriana var. granulata]|uniref:Uncharacterized protein n=1 Tax=Oryza meyeriana var. granulata TaxID=110450 RepID=A0A6G1BJJ6_9ORYZ|nr:hypothetical protein E2562_009605 [Oryza meyeriana var. granulata]
MCSAIAVEEVHLREGNQQLEVLIRAAKAVYDRDVAEVEWECTALDIQCVKAIAVRKEVVKALRELHGQREAHAILEARAEERELELAHREEAVTEREDAATQYEGVLHVAEARVCQSYEDMNKHEEQLV